MSLFQLILVIHFISYPKSHGKRFLKAKQSSSELSADRHCLLINYTKVHESALVLKEQMKTKQTYSSKY